MRRPLTDVSTCIKHHRSLPLCIFQCAPSHESIHGSETPAHLDLEIEEGMGVEAWGIVTGE